MDKKQLEELREYYDHADTTAELRKAELDIEVVQSPMIGITVRLPAELLREVRGLASGGGIKTTALIRRWIEEAVETQRHMSSSRSTSADSRAIWTILNDMLLQTIRDFDELYGDFMPEARLIA